MAIEDKVLAFWNDRAALGATAGTNDFILTEIEQRFLVETIPYGARVLDIGCGNGSSIIRLAKEIDCHGVGFDFAERMVETARAQVRNDGLTGRIALHQRSVPPVPAEWGLFDVAYSQRCLINLPTTAEQRDAVLSIGNILRPGGMYIMIECSLDGSERTNEIRRSLGLEPIEPPWHNRFFRETVIDEWSTDRFFVEDMLHISSTYNFLSRVVYAKLAADRGETLRYDSEINLLSLQLPPAIGDFGPVKAWVWRKR